ncbi:ATP-binding protein [Corynebacterium sp. zg-913]|uniref:ATP-binding protein n=1 Tax=Corynebacterium wankanglinii TaxID=2735136 RepID=A0A7H0K9B1_9CORY|nr:MULTISPECIES: ATP-binding protein [Corynebacterium]MBA1838390.1 ATP-binding protein [Corynebacterium wankanglinii]QNP93877.1 ATP-binding protein [Corynebacterium wankanglinii]
MNYRSQVRDSQVRELTDRVSKNKYEHYLKRMDLNRLRGLEDTSIQFDFPVTAIVGPNGSGKSTVLGAAALTSTAFKPSQFFAKAGKYDETMRNWSVEYELIKPADTRSKTHPRGKTSSMTASYRQSKWNRNAINRPAKLIGISRTIPAAEKKNLSSFQRKAFKAKYENPLTAETRQAVERILGKDATDYIKVSNDPNSSQPLIGTDKAIFARTLSKDSKIGYSQFHFGAGEASIISIVEEIETAGDGALILIEEIENGLHPVATKRLVEYLIDVARRKSAQILFTTHSNDALAPLPYDAVWSVANGKLSQGSLDVASLRALTGEDVTSCVVFTEDEFSKALAKETLRRLRMQDADGKSYKVDMNQVEIHGVGGEGNVIKFTETSNSRPDRKYPVLGLLDGDQKQYKRENPSLKFRDQTFRALRYGPGQHGPEEEIYKAVLDSFSTANTSVSLLTVALLGNSDGQKFVREKVDEIWRTNSEPHLLYSRLGEVLGFLDEELVTHAFLARWCELHQDESEAIWEGSFEALPWQPIDEEYIPSMG